MSHSTILLLSSAALLGAAPLSAQTAVSLTQADAQFAEPFTSVAAIRELPSGKVLVADRQDKVVQMIDFASGTMTKVGREGQGPGEYALPMGLIAMPNGVTWINDILGRRFLVVDPTGKPGTTVQLPGSTGGGIMIGGLGGGSDARGGYYYQASPFNSANPSSESPDSLAILRWDGKLAQDTVAWIVPAKSSISTSGGGGSRRVSMTIGGNKVFTPAEGWGVADDGSIARVLPNPYRVVWYTPKSAAPTAGPVQAYTPMKVTDADKKEVIEQRKKARPMFISVGPGGRQANTGNFQIPDPEFEDTKPPFASQGVAVAPDGEVWVQRTQPAGVKAPLYDVFDRSGKLTRKVTLRPASRVIGFGKGTVYVVRTDEDDLQYLERFRR